MTKNKLLTTSVLLAIALGSFGCAKGFQSSEDPTNSIANGNNEQFGDDYTNYNGDDTTNPVLNSPPAEPGSGSAPNPTNNSNNQGSTNSISRPNTGSTGNTNTGGSNNGSISTNTGVSKIGPNQSFVYAINGSSADKYNVKNVFVDLFDSSASRISKLRGQGKNVICYFSAGSSEDWRSDFKNFPSSSKGNGLDGWDGERWLDYRNSSVLNIMKNRISAAKSKGCNGIDPDNVDGHLNKTGFPLTKAHQKTYLTYLSQLAHSMGMSMGLKNSAETANSLVSVADFVVVEECAKYNECGAYSGFSKAGKAIFQIEYTGASSSKCTQARSGGRTLIFSNLALTNFNFCP